MATRMFDLNVEEVLDNWKVHHAIREVIANALDEQALSCSPNIRVFKGQGDWRIRDYGRGLQIDHFTLRENEEKLSRPSEVIGKFGVGLKDALAVFHRRGVDVWACSRYGLFHVVRSHKHEFENILTLHVEYDDTPRPIKGTEFVLRDVADADMKRAQSCFLRFSPEEVMESTHIGQILRRRRNKARVYISGVLANEEPGFLFSYNVTDLTDAMRKQLNRERINVGRSLYTGRVKAMLKAASSRAVRDALAQQVFARRRGDECDEMQWIEISQLAINLLQEQQQAAFVTEREMQSNSSLIDNMRRDGYEVVIISEREMSKLQEQALNGGPTVRTLTKYVTECEENFHFSFVEPDRLTPIEREVFDLTARILGLARVEQSLTVRISETMRVTADDTDGVWEPVLGAIVVKRSALRSIEEYAGTVLHEAAHAVTGASDSTRDFERVLTEYLGRIAATGLQVRR